MTGAYTNELGRQLSLPLAFARTTRRADARGVRLLHNVHDLTLGPNGGGFPVLLDHLPAPGRQTSNITSHSPVPGVGRGRQPPHHSRLPQRRANAEAAFSRARPLRSVSSPSLRLKEPAPAARTLCESGAVPLLTRERPMNAMFDADLEQLEDALYDVKPHDDLVLVFREVDDEEIDNLLAALDKLDAE